VRTTQHPPSGPSAAAGSGMTFAALRLVARLHVDLRRQASALCPR